YLEAYTAHMGLEPHYDTELQRVDRGSEDGLWKVETSQGPLLARYVVVATGYDAVPRLPEWAKGNGYAGELIHAAEYRSPKPYAGREVLIVGAGNTGIDIAGFLIKAGAQVSVSMRNAPNVFPRDYLGFPLQLSALPLDKLPARIGDTVGYTTQRMVF